jgi:serine/threonine protein kinase
MSIDGEVNVGNSGLHNHIKCNFDIKGRCPVCNLFGPKLEAIDSFNIVGRIKDSAWGDVYLVRPMHLNREFAMKVAKPGAEKKLNTEREILAKIGKHPNIPEIFFAGNDAEGNPYIVEDYVNSNLREKLNSVQKSYKGLEYTDALVITQQILKALGEAHKLKVVHRDLKPENVLVTKGTNDIKLCDFGMAEESGKDTGVESSLDDAADAAGTIRYLSPEQKNKKKVTARSDIYAVGLILYEMLVGELPQINYAKPSDAKVPRRNSRANMKAKWCWVDNVIEKALQPKASDRYSDVYEMERAIVAGLTPEPVKGPTTGERAKEKVSKAAKYAVTGIKFAVKHTLLLPIYIAFLPIFVGIVSSKRMDSGKYGSLHAEWGIAVACVFAIIYYIWIPGSIGDEYIKDQLAKNPIDGTIVSYDYDWNDPDNRHFSLLDASKLPEIVKTKISVPDASGKVLFTISDDGKFFYYTASSSLIEVNLETRQRKVLARSEILTRFNSIVYRDGIIYPLLDTEVWSITEEAGLKQHSSDIDIFKKLRRNRPVKAPYELSGSEIRFSKWYMRGSLDLGDSSAYWLDADTFVDADPPNDH